jgi:hypothetical protein|eukprot:COSAG01_NODE_35573_length_530_cov_0.714617_1_plen_83_part_00
MATDRQLLSPLPPRTAAVTQIGTQTCPYAGPDATLCAMVPGSKELATAGCRMPLSDRWQECEWTTGPCEYTPYYPISNLTGY